MYRAKVQKHVKPRESRMENVNLSKMDGWEKVSVQRFFDVFDGLFFVIKLIRLIPSYRWLPRFFEISLFLFFFLFYPFRFFI